MLYEVITDRIVVPAQLPAGISAGRCESRGSGSLRARTQLRGEGRTRDPAAHRTAGFRLEDRNNFV